MLEEVHLKTKLVFFIYHPKSVIKKMSRVSNYSYRVYFDVLTDVTLIVMRASQILNGV